MKKALWFIIPASLAVYWLLLLVLTHLPPIKPPLGEGTDKIEHVVAFGILAILLNLFLRARGSRHADWLTLLIILAYGAVDELSQPPFRRTCDLMDWFADCAGASLGVILCGLGSLVFRSRAAKEGTSAGQAEPQRSEKELFPSES